MPVEIRYSSDVWTRGQNSGFLAISFYSSQRSLDELYKVLEPILSSRLTKVQDASETGLYNPTSKEIRIELIQDKMASLGLLPRDVGRTVTTALGGNSGGTITVGTQKISVQMPRVVQKLEDLSQVLIQTPNGQTVHLSDIAHIDFGIQSGQSRSFKTSGQSSLILFSEPKPGGNIKKMAEDILDIVHEVEPSFPPDVQYKVLVDPSAFIRGAVHNVFHEVAIGALLAVLILFLFIGSFRNTITAAIEIPISMVLAFILMRLSGMNLNLFSLGGLALSAGMNVDASVVVMENIFRHFESSPAARSFTERLSIIIGAVKEVQFAVIASTLSSVVVFLPLAFTSDLSYAVLGDLAKTVVFSHSFSAFVALILVPTVRLQIMSSAKGKTVEVHSPIEKWIRKLERGYAGALGAFI
ncbi:MAG: efflux RND transporter permease subunit, partial [Bdellovibrionota bacterium]